MIVWGIDPGVSTGLAEWDTVARALVRVETTSIVRAIFELRDRVTRGDAPALVMIEDARKARTGRSAATYGQVQRLQGVGSVKRDCTVWFEALEALAVPYSGRAPSNTKTKAPVFQALTGWKGRTSNHARDAAMRVYGLNAPQVWAMVAEWRQSRQGA
jgi:hypothetical protein